jgi:tetratricopeptide (TPR) repeat protein
MQSPIALLSSTTATTQAPTSLWRVSDLYLKLGRVSQSLNLAYRVVQQDHSQQQQYRNHHLEALQLGAEFADEIGDYPRSVFYWEQLIQQTPQNADVFYGLGIAKANVQDYRGAAAALAQTLQLQPSHEKARSHLQEIQGLLNQ